jgi:glycosyltransferase involved in cell wall biosynthesis
LKERLTIGMPVFNDVDFIKESLNSLLNQSFDSFKLIISDDGSTDGSQLVCEKYAKEDSRIIYIRQPKNLGISKNMEFLLSQCTSEYFMWAGDDDLWDKLFIEKLILKLETENALSVFCDFAIIDDFGNVNQEYSQFNYENEERGARLVNFIKNSHDAFGYGIFKAKEIKDVEFPIWHWPNKNTPYNNIYPSLCYYLTKGRYAHVSGDVLFYKRVKTGSNVNHILTGENNAIKESFSFWVRRFNLVMFSSKMILKASGIGFFVYAFPTLFLHWFIYPSFTQFKLAANSFFKNRVKLKE